MAARTKARFRYYIGVDQTGAAVAGGARARPLPGAVAFLRPDGSWQIGVGWLPRFDRDSLETFLTEFCPEARLDSSCAVLVDCVFGLSRDVELGFGRPSGSKAVWAVLRRARDSTPDGPLYGRAIAERFFATLWAPRAGCALPRRECEGLARANSVFLTRPFQKNVQTGTFRIWREMASAKPWARIWPFDLPRSGIQPEHPDQPWIFEGYPSLIWREVLGVPTRDAVRLGSSITRRLGRIRLASSGRALLARSPDLRDAFVLAAGGAILDRAGNLMAPFPGFLKRRRVRSEGWIAGLVSDDP